MRGAATGPAVDHFLASYEKGLRVHQSTESSWDSHGACQRLLALVLRAIGTKRSAGSLHTSRGRGDAPYVEFAGFRP